MRTIGLIVSPRGYIDAPTAAILGRSGELGASRVTFDVSAWTENTIATYSIAVKDAAGTAWASHTGLNATNNIITADMPDALFNTAGHATLEIRGEESGAIIKSASVMLPIEAGLTTGTAPAADPAWIDRLSQAGAALGAQIDAGETLYADMEAAQAQVSTDAQAVASNKVAALAAKMAAEGARDDAEQSALTAANSLLNGVSTHNANTAAHEDIRDDVQRVEAIARGRATAHVFDTYAAMTAWLAETENVAELVTGDNLYIRDVGVKDFWWDGEAAQELEAEAPDLTDYYTKTQVDALLPIYLSQTAYDALVAAGTTEAGRVYYPIPDDQWEGA